MGEYKDGGVHTDMGANVYSMPSWAESTRKAWAWAFVMNSELLCESADYILRSMQQSVPSALGRFHAK